MCAWLNNNHTHIQSLFFVCKKTMGQKALIYRHFSKKIMISNKLLKEKLDKY